MTADPRSHTAENVLLVLDGLVPLHIMALADSFARERARWESSVVQLTDTISETGDRLLNPAQHTDRADRARLLSAIARALAIGAYQSGGVTWCGRHWCTDHAACAAPLAGGS
jgi:hypothetical protein